MPNIVIFSFFSGVGILDLAFEKNGYEIVFVNEYESCFMEAYEFSRKNLQIKEPRLGYSNKSALAYTKGKNKQKLMRIIQEEKAAGNIVGFIGGPPYLVKSFFLIFQGFFSYISQMNEPR